MDVDLSKKVALVTGAGRGNGRAIATTLAANGAKVVVNDIERGPAEETVTAITENGGSAHSIAADITDEAAVEAMVEETEQKYGNVDILVNNAGVSGAAPMIAEPDDELWSNHLETHLWGSIYCIKHVLSGMTEQEYGKIINITSIHTKNGVGFTPQYDVAKFGVLGLTKNLALELGQFGIRVNAVAPGHAKTRMTADLSPTQRERITDQNPLGRFAEPEEIAEAAAFLAAPASDYINGHELRVDGGQAPIVSFQE